MLFVSEAVDRYEPEGTLDVPHMISWADIERDLSAWLGNAMQSNALHEVYRLEKQIKDKADPNRKALTMVPAATIMDNKPCVNVAPFGMCQSPANPTVAAATAAALGVPTPMPCVPMTTAPWIAGQPTILIGNFPALNKESMLICNWGGVIQITMPGQFVVQL